MSHKVKAAKAAKIVTKILQPKLWDDLETLFGPKGAVGGCWCMFWRIEKGEQWTEVQGPTAKKRFKGLVKDGDAKGVLAYVDGEPVGWCALGQRRDFAKLDRAPSLKCDDADAVWSIPCFYIKPGFRDQGVATALLAAAVVAIEKAGGTIAEGYPVKPTASGAKTPAAFAWTGTRPLFTKQWFKLAGNKGGGKERFRRSL